MSRTFLWVLAGLVMVAVGCSGSSGGSGTGTSTGSSGSSGGSGGAVNFAPTTELVHVDTGFDPTTNTTYVTHASFVATDFQIECADFPNGSVNLRQTPALSNHVLQFEVSKASDGGAGEDRIGPGGFSVIAAGAVPPLGNYAQGELNFNGGEWITVAGGTVTLSQLDPSGAAGSYAFDMSDGVNSPVSVSGSLSPTTCP